MQTEQLRQDLESAHKKSSQELHSRLTELEASCRELTERKYKNESVIRDLKIKLVGAEEVSEGGGWESSSMARMQDADAAVVHHTSGPKRYACCLNTHWSIWPSLNKQSLQIFSFKVSV